MKTTIENIKEYYIKATADEILTDLENIGISLTKEQVLNKYLETFDLFETANYYCKFKNLEKLSPNNPSSIAEAITSNPFIFLIPKIIEEYKFIPELFDLTLITDAVKKANSLIETDIEAATNIIIPLFDQLLEASQKRNNLSLQIIFGGYSPRTLIMFVRAVYFITDLNSAKLPLMKKLIEQFTPHFPNDIPVCIDLKCAVLEAYAHDGYNEITNNYKNELLAAYPDFQMKVYNALFNGFEQNKHYSDIDQCMEEIKTIKIANIIDSQYYAVINEKYRDLYNNMNAS